MKKIISILLTLIFMAALLPTSIMAENVLTFDGFNATKTVITMDFGNVNGAISSASADGKITVQKRTSGGAVSNVDFAVSTTSAKSGTDSNGSSITTAGGNTVIITPNGGLDTENLYRVTVSAGVSDTSGTALASEVSTGWFRVNEIFFDDFNITYEQDGTTPVSPYYIDSDEVMKSQYWNAKYAKNHTGFYDNKLQIRNGTRYAVLNSTGFPIDNRTADFTIEYQLGLSKNNYYKIPQYASLRNSDLQAKNDPENYVDRGGYLLGVDSDYNYSGDTGSLFLRAGNIDNTPIMKVSGYQFSGKTVAVRAVADGSHLQYYIDNDKIFDLTDTTYNAQSTVGFAGGCAWNESPATTIDNLSITTVTKNIQTEGISLNDFNATKSVITVDFNNVSGKISVASLDEKIAIQKRASDGTISNVDFAASVTNSKSGTDSNGNSITTAGGNTVIITPNGGLDTESLYKVTFSAGVSDTGGNLLASDASTGWFKVNELFADNFNVAYEQDGTTPQEPIYKENNATKSRYWDANYDGTNTGILNDKLQIRNGTRYAVLNKTGLPDAQQAADFTIEYQLGLSKNNYYKIPQYTVLRNSELRTRNDPLNYVGNSGYLLGVDSDYNYSGDTGSLFLRAGNIDNTPIMKVSGYQFSGKTVAVRAVADGSHLQYYIDNDKIFDLTDTTYTAQSTIAFAGGCAWNENPATTIDNLSITTVKKYGDIDITGLSLKGFNATKSVITADFDHINGQIDIATLENRIVITKNEGGSTEEITDYTVNVTSDVTGSNSDSEEIITAKGNTIIITPSGGIDTGCLYNVEFKKDIADEAGSTLAESVSTGWFKVNELFADDFNVAYEQDGTTPKEPIYKENNATKSRYWDANYDGTNTGILNDKLQIRNQTRYAVLNKTGLPNAQQSADFTIEYQLGLSRNNYYKIPQYTVLRNSELRTRNDPLNYVGKSGYLLGVDTDYNSDNNTGSLFLRVGDIENTPIMKVPEYQFGSATVAVRAVADGSHLQYYIDNNKVFDLTDTTYGAQSTIGFAGGSAWNERATTIDDLSITSVTKMDNIPKRADIASYNADLNTIYLEVSGIDTVSNPISESSLGGIKLYDKNGSEVAQEVSLQNNYIIIKPTASLSLNQKYTIEVKGVRTEYGTILMDYTKNFKVLEVYSESFNTAGSLSNWNTQSIGSWDSGKMKLTNTSGSTKQHIFSSGFKGTNESEYITEFDLYIYDENSFSQFMFYSNKSHNKAYNEDEHSIDYTFGKDRDVAIYFYKDWDRSILYSGAKSSNLNIATGTVHKLKTVNKNNKGFMYVDGKLEAEYDYTAVAPLGEGCLGFLLGDGTTVGIDNIMCTYAVDYEDEEITVPVEITETLLTTEGNTATVKVTVADNYYSKTSYKVIVALYDANDKMIGVKSISELSAAAGTSKQYTADFTNVSNVAYGKAFLWNETGFGGMEPIASPHWFKITTYKTLYVDAQANTLTADGTSANPYATIASAIDKIEADVRGGASSVNYTVDIASGDMYLNDTLTINDYSQLLKSAGITVTVQGQGTDSTYIKTGKAISADKFQKVTDSAILNKIATESARNYIYAADLSSDVAEGKSIELSHNGAVQTLAKYPNSGYLTTGTVSNSNRTFYAVSRAASWNSAANMYIYYMPNYFSYSYPVTASGRYVTTTVKDAFAKNNNYYVYNLLEELDSAGEYYFDKASRKLYIYSQSAPSGKYEIYNMEKALVSLQYCDNVKFKDMTFENGSETLIELKNTTNSGLESCVLRNGTKMAAVVSGGSNSGLYDCDIYGFGKNGVALSGGNRDTLRKAGNYVDHCSIHDCQRTDRSYNALVSVSGVGNKVINSDIYNSYHQAITIYGNDLEIKNNKIYNVCTETADMGAIYAEGDWTLRGTVIEHNYFNNIPSVGTMGAFAIYLDNGISGITVKDNIFKNCATQAVYINGGRDNLVTNNIFVDCGNTGAISDIFNWGDGYSFENPAPANSKLVNNLNKVKYKEEPYTKYEHLATILTDKPSVPKYNRFVGNVTVNTAGLSTKWLKNTTLSQLKSSGGCAESSYSCSTSDLTNYSGGNYTLKEAKAQALGFEYFNNTFGK